MFKIENSKPLKRRSLLIILQEEVWEKFERISKKERISKQNLAAQMVEYCLKEIKE